MTSDALFFGVVGNRLLIAKGEFNDHIVLA